MYFTGDSEKLKELLASFERSRALHGIANKLTSLNNKMYKKFAFSLILVLSLFITKDAFASDFEAYATYQNGIVDFSQMQDTYPLTTDPECSFYCTGSYISSIYIYKGSYLDKTNYQLESYDRILWTIPSVNYNNLGDYISGFVSNQNPSDGDYWVDISFANREVWNNPVPLTDKAYFTFSVLNGSLVNLSSPSSPLVSGIDKVSLYTLNNEDLDSITTPIPFDAGHQIHFFNYEEDSYQYLAFNMTICHNGQLEGCTVNNETFVEDVIDISSLGFSSSGNPPLSVKLNFKDVVTQSDLVNITWFLTNCPNVSASCPDGVSAGRGYTYLINNSLASDSWLTFDDPARPECSIARLDVCLINAVNYFIKPRSSGFANSFSVASTRINERIPFVYLYAVRDAISDIFNSPTASVNWSVSFGSVGSLTVLDSDSFSGSPYYSFFTGMRVYLGYLLWILLGVGLYKRAVRLFDDKTVA